MATQDAIRKAVEDKLGSLKKERADLEECVSDARSALARHERDLDALVADIAVLAEWLERNGSATRPSD